MNGTVWIGWCMVKHNPGFVLMNLDWQVNFTWIIQNITRLRKTPQKTEIAPIVKKKKNLVLIKMEVKK